MALITLDTTVIFFVHTPIKKISPQCIQISDLFIISYSIYNKKKLPYLYIIFFTRISKYFIAYFVLCVYCV